MPLIFFGSKGIGLSSNIFGLGVAAGWAVAPGAVGGGVCAAASGGHIAAVTAAPAVNADPACTKLRRSNSFVIGSSFSWTLNAAGTLTVSQAPRDTRLP